MKQIIVNADDFGITEVVTAEIERMVELGAISSTTVMANGFCLDEVKRFASLHPEVSFGVHLCLSEFGSVTKNKGLFRAGLTDENGNFVHKAIFRLNNLDDTEVRMSIKEELNAQIDVVSGLGFPVSHADSHHHVHTIYPLRELFAELVKERGIKKLRLEGDFRTLRMKAHVRLWMRQRNLNKYYKSCFTTTAAFYSYSEYLKYGMCKDDEKNVELMCHPGHPGKMYREEMKLVGAKLALKGDNIKLISYNELY